jgi:hypothetical protein
MEDRDEWHERKESTRTAAKAGKQWTTLLQPVWRRIDGPEYLQPEQRLPLQKGSDTRLHLLRMRIRDLFGGCYVTALPIEHYWTVRLIDSSGRILSSRICLSIEDTVSSVQQWLTVVDDDTEISDQDPAMQDEVASLLREAIVTTAAGEQVDLPHAIAALIGRERLRGWFQSQMDDAPDDT